MFITQERVRQLLEYRDGELYWKEDRGRIKKGQKAGGVRKSDGYKTLMIDKVGYLYHRIVFLYHHGYLPMFIDHIDGNKENNAISNLRPCSSEENQWNRKKNVNNTSGHKGVSFNKRKQKWDVQVRIKTKLYYFGNYDDFELACLVADEARNKYHGSFARNL